MEINGERIIGASRQTVWDAINDPEILKQCIPGGESVDRTSDSEMKAVVMAKIGPVRARFSGKMTMTDVVAPTSCTIIFEGTGGPAGFAKGQASVTLTAQGPTETLLVFTAAATVGGKLGQIGARLIESAARTISDEFFTKLMTRLSPDSEQESASQVARSGATQDAPTPATPYASSSAPTAPAGAQAAAATTTSSSASPARTWSGAGGNASGSQQRGRPVPQPGYILVDTRWFIAIGCLILGFAAGRLF
jgi:carbon monoxide dehydrogenase subunit G